MDQNDNQGRGIDASQPFERQLAAFLALVKDPPRNSRVIEITPALAAWLLDEANNRVVRQRQRSQAKVAKIAEAIEAGAFLLTGDTIKFGRSGSLLDGQHRLSACVRAQAPFKTHVVFGIADDVFARLDLNRPRRGGDVFHIAGIPMAEDMASTVRWLLLVKNGEVRSRKVYEPPALFDAYNSEFKNAGTPALEDCVRVAREIGRKRQPVSIVAAINFLAARKNRRKADMFFAAWASGGYDRASAIGKLQALTEELAAENNGRIHDVERAAMIINAWNMYASGLKGDRKRLRWKTGDDFPVIGA